ncbi:hypothetical protein OIU76_021884 [Salix suchowensis]|nr:hypothetical protein OIU76_021884 [Salix suchowensis]
MFTMIKNIKIEEGWKKGKKRPVVVGGLANWASGSMWPIWIGWICGLVWLGPFVGGLEWLSLGLTLARSGLTGLLRMGWCRGSMVCVGWSVGGGVWLVEAGVFWGREMGLKGMGA